MQGKRVLNRASYENDSAFERDVDQVAQVLETDGKRQLLFSLLRECRGCGQEPTFDNTEYGERKTRGSVEGRMVCRVCKRDVPIIGNDRLSVGRIVTLWNTTPLTIEGCHA